MKSVSSEAWLVSLLVFICFSFNALARDITVKGKVVCGGDGVSGVWVSDGDSFALTDAKGRYTLEADDSNHFIFICVPRGYDAPDKEGVVQYYLPMPSGKALAKGCDFTLTRRIGDDSRQVIIVDADPQVASESELPYLQKAVEDIKATVASIRAEAPDTLVSVHGICCGDITFNQYRLFSPLNSVMETSGIVFRNTVGNHDFKNGGRSFETSLSLFEEEYGPTYFSYDVGQCHFVFMDDCFFVGRQWYYIGYLTEKQLAWLEKDLSHVTPGSVVFVVMHMPTTQDLSDRKSFSYDNVMNLLCNTKPLYDMLKPFEAHILTGHMHTACNQQITGNLYEHNVPSIGGAWWQGPVCTDGTPAGYEVVQVYGNKVKWFYKSVGYPEDYQMKLYTEADSKDFEGYAVANIWNMDPSWKVTFTFDLDSGTASESESSTASAIPEVFEAIDPLSWKLYGPEAKTAYNWLQYTPAKHFFRARIPDGARSFTVAATDGFGVRYTATRNL